MSTVSNDQSTSLAEGLSVGEAQGTAVNAGVNDLKDLRSRNWGDAIGRFLHRAISGRKPRLIPMFRESSRPHFLTVGSTLRMCDGNSIVWGSGFLCDDDGLGLLHWGQARNECLRPPMRVLAVRGPLTREKLRCMGVACPSVFGDPVLLMPKLYKPPRRAKYRLGIVPHWTERGLPVVQKLQREEGVKVIDIVFSRFSRSDYAVYFRFIDDICSCEKVLSSSLHGIVTADAYGVPAHWIKLADKRGYEDFKYRDYFATVGRTGFEAIAVTEDTTYKRLIETFPAYNLKLSVSALWDSCPFRQ